MVERREFLLAGGGLAGVAAVGTLTGCAPPVPIPPGVFTLGVASGLHSPTEAVLWTRVELANAGSVTEVGWEVATSPAFTTIVGTGTAPVGAGADGCVKVLVESLEPDTSYWFRFTGGSEISPTGRARTLPPPDSSPPRSGWRSGPASPSPAATTGRGATSPPRTSTPSCSSATTSTKRS